MKNANYYLSMLLDGKEIYEVNNQIKRDAISDISDIICDYDGEDAYDFLKQIDMADDIHRMEELDDEFAGYSVTEVLKELNGIDTDDEWFSTDKRESGGDDDLLYLADVDVNFIAHSILDGDDFDIDDDDIDDVIDEYDKVLGIVLRESKKFENAKALFNDAMNGNDIDAVINALWNINQ